MNILKKITRITIIVLVGAIFIFGVIPNLVWGDDNVLIIGENDWISKDEVNEVLRDMSGLGYTFDKKLIIHITKKEDNLIFGEYSENFFSDYISLHNNTLMNYSSLTKEEQSMFWKSTLLHELGHYFETKLSESDREKWKSERNFTDGFWVNDDKKLREKSRNEINAWNNSNNEVFAEDFKAIVSFQIGYLDVDPFLNIDGYNNFYIYENLENPFNIIAFLKNDTKAKSLSIHDLHEVYVGFLSKIK